MAEVGKDIYRAASLLKAGELVAIPTETVYGLAADATRQDAVLKIFEVKKRPQSNPLILHFSSIDKITPYVSSFPERLKLLAEHFWPGPLTLLLPKSEKVLPIVNAGLDHVAVRIPNHELTLRLLDELTFPMAAPSANPFSYISPTKAEHVNEQLGDQLRYILDGDDCERGLESTIVGLKDDVITIYRLGAITPEEISSQSGAVVSIHVEPNEKPDAPGGLPYHYSPRTPIVIEDQWNPEWLKANIGVITYSWKSAYQRKQTIRLSDGQEWKPAAKSIYRAMYDLDQMQLRRIIVQRFPNEGLGLTLNDRLQHATAPQNNM